MTIVQRRVDMVPEAWDARFVRYLRRRKFHYYNAEYRTHKQHAEAALWEALSREQRIRRYLPAHAAAAYLKWLDGQWTEVFG